MKNESFSSNDFNKIVDSWAVDTLENFGVFEGSSSKFEEIKVKIIAQLKAQYSNKAIEKFLNPVDSRQIESPDGYAKITGPCGDTLEIYLKVENGKIIDASFQTDGCNPSIAAGGMITELAHGLMIGEAGGFTQQDVLDALGGLPHENEHCALLAVNTLNEALDNIKGNVLS
jgi:nitrogen fixation protein NifU and related proteins